jgi:hypothetical protein
LDEACLSCEGIGVRVEDLLECLFDLGGKVRQLVHSFWILPRTTPEQPLN